MVENCDFLKRLRKRPPRCTLDCGFKTSESPALRGFVAGPRALATAALYLVLKSNGLRHLKNLPVKFGFSLKTVPANIAKKLPSQRCSQPLFNFSHKRPTFAFTGESGYTTRLLKKDRTQRLTRRNTGSSLSIGHSVALCCQRNCHRKNSWRKWMHALWRVSAFAGVAAPLGCAVLLCICKTDKIRCNRFYTMVR